jgi:Predicted RNA-binding protein
MARDEYAYVLEYLPYGLAGSKDRRPSAIILTDSLGLLLVALKKESKPLEAGLRVYIGENKREEVHHIIERISPDKLSENGMLLLREKIKENVLQNEKKYIEVIDKIGPVNVRLHALSLIPGIGKKMVQKVIEEREKRPFESYQEMEQRVGSSYNVAKSIEDRIIEEMENKDKYRIFT